MICTGINFFEYSKTLRCFPEAFIFEIGFENLFNHRYGFLLGHGIVLKVKGMNKMQKQEPRVKTKSYTS